MAYIRGEHDPRHPHDFGWRHAIGIVVFCIFVLILGLAAAGAQTARPFCSERAGIVAALAEKHGERQLITDAQGRACIVATGSGWTMIEPARPSY